MRNLLLFYAAVMLAILLAGLFAADAPPAPLPVPDPYRGDFLALAVRQQNIVNTPEYQKIAAAMRQIQDEWTASEAKALASMKLDPKRYAIQTSPAGEVLATVRPAPTPAAAQSATPPAPAASPAKAEKK